MATVRISSRPAGRERDAPVAKLHETVRFQGAQPLEFVREIAFEMHAMPALDGGHIDAAMAHESVDDVLTQHIVASSCMRRGVHGSAPPATAFS